VVTPETNASDVLERIDDATDVVLVMAEGDVVGVLRPQEIVRYAHLQRELRVAAPRPLGADSQS
jgi:hypothetical protein